MKMLLTLTALGFTAACGSSSSVVDKIYVPLDGAGTTTLATTVPDSTAEFNRDNGTITFNDEIGQLNAAGDTVTFASGATMALSGLDNSYSRQFVLSGSEPAFGAYGVDTEARDLPGGSATYSGETTLVVTSPDGIFDLTGDANASVNFRSDAASLTLNNLSGTQATGLSSPEDVNDFGDIVFADIDLSGNTLSGGTVTIDTDETAAFDTDASGDVNGTFFGPSGEELGGSFNITGDAASVDGGFIAAQ